MKIPTLIQVELDKIPGRWSLENGSKHYHLLIDGRLVAILPKGRGSDRAPNGTLNLRAQIRRSIRAHA